MRIELPAEKCGRWELRAAALSAALDLVAIKPEMDLDFLLAAAARFEAYIAGDREQR